MVVTSNSARSVQKYGARSSKRCTRSVKIRSLVQRRLQGALRTSGADSGSRQVLVGRGLSSDSIFAAISQNEGRPGGSQSLLPV
ncbi:hypothetical protein R1flu_003955 [Riccia fluitans]|uniref:Ribosomal protein S12 n=1 Tax=Riccia fluitans TaxID=41844 RepID=A0ABD1YNW9_9MARC